MWSMRRCLSPIDAVEAAGLMMTAITVATAASSNIPDFGMQCEGEWGGR